MEKPTYKSALSDSPEFRAWRRWIDARLTDAGLELTAAQERAIARALVADGVVAPRVED